jgi:hypothetical protein
MVSLCVVEFLAAFVERQRLELITSAQAKSPLGHLSSTARVVGRKLRKRARMTAKTEFVRCIVVLGWRYCGMERW